MSRLNDDASTSRRDGGAKNDDDGTRDHDLVDVSRGHGTGGGTDDGARGRGTHRESALTRFVFDLPTECG